MKFKSKIKRLLLTTGMVLALGLLGTGCSAKGAVPVESTQVETVAETQNPYAIDKDVPIEETTVSSETLALNESETVEVGVYESGDKAYTFDRYGDLGKEVFDGVAKQWVNWIIEDEPSLRAVMDDMYGELPTKEELTQEILAMQRTQQGLSASVLETNPSVQEVKDSNISNQDKPAETKPAQTKAQSTPKQETQPAPVEQSQPAPTQATPQADPNDGFAQHIDEIKDKQEAALLEQVTAPGGDSYDYSEPLQGIKWN